MPSEPCEHAGVDEPDLEPLLRYWRAHDALFDRVEPAWWGAVVSDPRFPHVQEPNYARVESRQPVGLAEVEGALLPAMAASGSRRSHVVVFHPDDQTDLVVEASTRGETIAWDLVMQHAGLDEVTEGPVATNRLVEELQKLDAAFWDAHRESLRWFEVTHPDVLDQVRGIERRVLVPAGRRWFAVRRQGTFAALAALLVLERVGYLDHVVTSPTARRRGFASALARRAVAEATSAGAERTYLLAEADGAAAAMYARVGFRPVTTIASWVAPIGARART